MAKKVITDEYIFKSKVWFQDFVAARFGIRRGEKPFITKYDTGWISRSDWTNVHLGSNRTKNTDSNVAHNLGAPLSDLLVKVLISTDGTDANSFEIIDTSRLYPNITQMRGLTTYAVDNNNLIIQTAETSVGYVTHAGLDGQVSIEDWYYKIKVWHIG